MTQRAALLLLLLPTLNLQLLTVLAQGDLAPPGPPAPTMKTLAQIEPRTPISILPYFITNSGSYYVTTNLTGQPGINVFASGVTIDLMGFELVGGGGVGGCNYGGPVQRLRPKRNAARLERQRSQC